MVPKDGRRANAAVKIFDAKFLKLPLPFYSAVPTSYAVQTHGLTIKTICVAEFHGKLAGKVDSGVRLLAILQDNVRCLIASRLVA